MNWFSKFFNRISLNSKIIFIVEDNEVYAKSLKSFIQNCFPKVNEIKIFRIGEMCLLELHRNPCIVIMDYFLNSQYGDAENGLEIIKRIKKQNPQTNIILLSAQEKFDIAIEAIEQHNCTYVQKDQDAFNKVENIIKGIFKRIPTPAVGQWN